MKLKLLAFLLLFSFYAAAQCDCGDDSALKTKRKAITGSSCDSLPYKFIYHLSVKKGCKWYWGTASRVGNEHLITARHVINSRIWGNARKIKLYACNSSKPLLTLKKRDFEYETKSKGDVRYLHIINREKLHLLNIHSKGYFNEMIPELEGTFLKDNVSYYPDSIYMAGYSCDPGDTLMHKSTTKYYIDKNGNIGYYLYSCNGDSGAPLWVEVNGVYYLIAIHHGGPEKGMPGYKIFDENKMVAGTFLNAKMPAGVHKEVPNFSRTIIEPTPVSSPDVLFTAFRQGNNAGSGNCAAIALIKAAIATFGVNGVFEYAYQNGVYNIILKTGTTLTITDVEFEQAKLMAGFVDENWNGIDDLGEEKRSIANYARLCYAVMGKMVMKEGDGNRSYNKVDENGFIDSCNYKSYRMALLDINDGGVTPTTYHLLGLDSNVYQYKAYKCSKNIKAGITWSSAHAMYISRGYCDRYGTKKKLCKYPQSSGRIELLKDKAPAKRNKKKPFYNCR